MNRISAAIAASRYLRDRYARAGIHNEYDVDPQPDADGSTAFLEQLSQALVEHPDRPRQWVRPDLISDREQPSSGSSPAPGRNPIEGDAAWATRS